MVGPHQVGVAHLALAEGDTPAGTVDHDDVLHGLHVGTGGAQDVEEGHDLASAVGAVRHDDGHGPRRPQPGGDGLGAEPREQDRVDGTEPVAGVDGDEGFHQVGHVDGDHVTAAHAE